MVVKYLLKVAMLGSAWVMYLLLALSVASIAVMVERWVFFRKRGVGGEELCDALIDLLERGDRAEAEGLLQRHPSIEAEVLLASLRWAQGGPDALAAGIDGEMTKRRRDLESGMTLLGTLGNNAPFVGLFGTVIGIIQAFDALKPPAGLRGAAAAAAAASATGRVMGTIAEALVATAIGLLVAIPAVASYNFFQRRIKSMLGDTEALSQLVLAYAHTREREEDKELVTRHREAA